MRKTGLAIIAVAVATALLVWWLQGEWAPPQTAEAPLAVVQARSFSPSPSVMSPPASPEEAPSAPRESEDAGGCQVRGRVIDAITLLGIADAEVEVMQAGLLVSEPVQPDGTFCIVVDRVDKTTALWMLKGARAAKYLPNDQKVLLGKDGPPIEIRLTPARKVVGTVVNASREPVADAEILPHHAKTVKSDAEGRFEVYLGAELELEVSHPDYVKLEVEARDGLVIVLQPLDRVPLTGIVVDEEGRAIEGAAVNGIAVSALQGTAQGISLKSDAAGRFSVDVAKDATLELHGTKGETASVEVVAKVGQTPRVVLLTYESVISGKVLNARRAPVTSFEVHVTSKDFSKEVKVYASADGTYRATGFPRMSSAAVMITALGFLKVTPRIVTLSRGQQLRDVDFTLEEGRSLPGVVIDKETQAPLAHANVSVANDLDPRRGRNGTARTDAQGRFVLQGLAPGPLELSARRSGYLDLELSVAAGDDRELRIELRSQLTADGKLVVEDYEGVGMKFENAGVPDEGRGYVVAALHPQGGALAAGMQVGDEIMAVGSTAAGTTPTTAFLRQIKGPSGTTAHLTIRRRGESFELNVARRRLGAW